MSPAREAVLLVGGRGTRLRPLTLTTPKPMLPAAGVPFLTHQLVRARQVGVEHIVIATAYRPETFAGHFGDGSAYGVALDYSTEAQPLGTGGAIRAAAAWLAAGPDDPVLVLNGDILSGHDLRAQLVRHQASGADVTLHLIEVEDARAFGVVPTDGEDRVTAFHEKMPEPVSSQVNAGCYVFRRAVLNAIPPDRPVSVERETFPALLRAHALMVGHLDPAYWIDVGTPAAYVRVCADLVRGRAPAGVALGPSKEALVLSDGDVAPDAVLTGGATVGSGARVGAGAVVDGSVLLDGAGVGPAAVVRRSAVGAGAVVGAGVVVEDAVLGDGAVVHPGNELRAGVRLWPGVELPPTSVRFSGDES